ncbi:MAG: cellobiose phosphorylase [Alphaproteobacteria bacterium]|nr:cellobiose phosphorylase [Alphaproteobacteria bacterium]
MAKRIWTTPREKDLGLSRIENATGLTISVLPNGALFAIEHRREEGVTVLNQFLGSPLAQNVTRIYLRPEGLQPHAIPGGHGETESRFGAAADHFLWEGRVPALRYHLTLSLHPSRSAWLWELEVRNEGEARRQVDAILIEDIGLGDRGFLMNNEAYASQYIDHHVARHPLYGPVVMSRQNLSQGGKNPWVALGCLDGASSFATDGKEIFGPGFRDSSSFPLAFGESLPNRRLQHEVACVALQTREKALSPGASVVWRFFGLYEEDHAKASSDEDLAALEGLTWEDFPRGNAQSLRPLCSLVEDARAATAEAIDIKYLQDLYPDRRHEEWTQEEGTEKTLLSFFSPAPPLNRHIVLKAKEERVTRRHGTLLRSGHAMLPDNATLCATLWMHGVFAAQLTIGNTSFHKLFSVSRDPYNITRASGLRILIDMGAGWRLLTVPSIFEMGLSDCRWIYQLEGRRIAVSANVSGEDPALQLRIRVEGEVCRFLIFGHLVLGERELESQGRIEADAEAKRFSFHPDPEGLWGQHYPQAVYHLVTSTPDGIDALGGDELLYADGESRHGAYMAIRTKFLNAFSFAVTGSLDDPETAERLARKYESGVDEESLRASSENFWKNLSRALRFVDRRDQEPFDTLYPWLAHNAMIHLSVPHGLEQYTGAAWGTRDVCQGPVEALLALEHDETVKDILRLVFAQQYEESADWPQWFMHAPYAPIQARESQGDIIVWPLKALNDYLETTGDFAFLDEKIVWRRSDTFETTTKADAVAEHIAKLLVTVKARFIPGTHLIRYGEGDWNDSLQPVDPHLHNWMVSSWTVALLYEQVSRYTEVLKRAGRPAQADEAASLANAIRADFNRCLIRDGTVAGYGIFTPGQELPQLLLHPSDEHTGLHYSLLPMTQAILGGLFTPDQIAHHRKLIGDHLRFPDGVRLMDRPVGYHGGPQTLFRRAESSSFFGREIGLMYTHAHLRCAEAMGKCGDAEAMGQALQLANPISVTNVVPRAGLRQRNAYFSSSDAAFTDRYAASQDWHLAQSGEIDVEGGWRVYSSGPGIFISLLIRYLLGHRRRWGERYREPLADELSLRFTRHPHLPDTLV